MENNAIMQRVMMLSEMWASSLVKHPEKQVFAWVGASSVEFKTIKGFVMYQTSMEKTLQDTFICLTQPFEPEQTLYGQGMVNNLQEYFEAWNKDASLSAGTGIIQWNPASANQPQQDPASFLSNMLLLADALKVDGKQGKLVLALFPNALNDPAAFSQWIAELIDIGIPDRIKVMLYESRDSLYFRKLEKNKGEKFLYLYPDLDIAGAMDQILEDTKAGKASEEEKDMVSFQQSLIKLNEAVGYRDEGDVKHYRDSCLKQTKKYDWLHQEALVYFFMHTFYSAAQQIKLAHESIDQSIALSITATERELIQNNQTIYQYYIAKGNLFFMHKDFKSAAEVYQQCLQLDSSNANVLMLAGIHQMLGNSLRKSATKAEARECFATGWQLLYANGEEELKDNAMAMFYAKDMLSVADESMSKTYVPLMDKLWGINWINNLADQYHQLTKTK